MKKVIRLTESDLLNLVKRIIKGSGDKISKSESDNPVFEYLDNQDFIQIKEQNRVYFVNSDNDEYAQIRFDKKTGWCGISDDLIKEISSFFSLQISDSKKVISRWVEFTLQMRVTSTERNYYQRSTGLKVLSRWMR